MFSADEEDDKSIYNHRENGEEPAENPNPRFHWISSKWLSRTFQSLSSVKPIMFWKVFKHGKFNGVYIEFLFNLLASSKLRTKS